MMAMSVQDTSQWLSVTEETLFMHDGLVRVSDLVELPVDVSARNEDEGQEMVSFDTKNPADLSENLKAVCGTQNNAYTRLLEYRLSAVKGLWSAQMQVAVDEETEKEGTSDEETITLLKKQGIWKEQEATSFSTRVSLLLVLPLIESQSRIDTSLGGITAELLLNCLKDCPPLSLSKEPSDCLTGIETLLCNWLEDENKRERKTDGTSKRQSAASALVALAAARGNLKTFIHVVHLLQSLHDVGPLQVADILTKLCGTEGGKGQPSSFLGSKHILCWGLEDTFTIPEKDQQSANEEKQESGRSIACDGTFLYMTSATGKGLVKIGTGLNGTLRGYVYRKNEELTCGKVAYAGGVLLFRPTNYDRDVNAQQFLLILDTDNLSPQQVVTKPEAYVPASAYTTVALCSDGRFFYWLWVNATVAEKNVKGQVLSMECFTVKKSGDAWHLTVERPRTAVQRRDEASGKSVSDALLSRLRPYRASCASSAATLVALTGGDPTIVRREDNNTSCGVSLSSLLKTPIYCDGTTLVLLTPIPGSSGGGGGGSARFSFGATSGLPALRSLASNLCYSVADGQFTARTDIVDAPTCALARGAPLQGMGVCYDVSNHMIWMCGSDWVDEFYNPAHQATHHVLSQLSLPWPQKPIQKSDNQVERDVVICTLLQHVGMMCIHQLNNDLLHTALGNLMLQQTTVDAVYLTRVCDILEKAVSEGNHTYTITALVALQLLFKMSQFSSEQSEQKDQITKISKLLWDIHARVDAVRDEHSTEGAMQEMVCKTLLCALPVTCPTAPQQHQLLHRLLAQGDEWVGSRRLRDMMLVDFGTQLRSQVIDAHKVTHLRLSGELLQHIVKMCLKESYQMLQQAQTVDRDDFENLLCNIPMASPCLRYLMALQTHLLRAAVLYHADGEREEGAEASRAKSTASTEGSRGKNTSAEALSDLQGQVLAYASKIFTASHQLVEKVLETCSVLLSAKPAGEAEFWLSGVERIAKASVLGHLLPTLVTCMTHYNLRCLHVADSVMSQLAQLIIVTSQAALLMKSQVQAVKPESSLDLSPDVDIETLIGETINIDSFEVQEKEEQGFLAGLKIPTPWTTGKSLESIHPVRDNYKYKETVHIAGARSLYLRFDPRCSSQYDYDKLIVYAGSSTSAKKVAEYGGNTLGFGSRSVLGSGWPKDLVKVEGDSVTLSFEMRSGREHNTPDKAMWGFQVTVRAQEKSEEAASGLPFLADLALALSVLGCTMLHLLYHGPDRSADEERCEHLLKSKLLQRCVWQPEASEGTRLETALDWPVEESPVDTLAPASPGHKVLPRIRMPSEIVKKLRDMGDKHPLHMRPSMRDVIKADVLEETVLSAAIKHLSLMDVVRNLANHEQHNTEEYRLLQAVTSEIYRKLHALIRQLQNLAELEQKWKHEVEEIRQGALTNNEVFFIDYHLQEDKCNDLVILCFLKDVPIDLADLDSAVSNLREKLDAEVEEEAGGTPAVAAPDARTLPRTRAVTHGLLERLSLLLHVTIMPEVGQVAVTRSRSTLHGMQKQVSSMARSDTDVLKGVGYGRSMSLPLHDHGTLDDSVLEIVRLQKRRQRKGAVSLLQELVEDDLTDKPPHILLVDQLFSFIGSSPEKAVSCESFLAAAMTRSRRGHTRRQALVHMKELLSAAARVGGATHLVAAVTSVLQHGPKVEQLTCGGMATYVREAFAETMTSVVQLAARYPIACCNSIGLLCIIPYTRAEERCLVRSGLVHLLDKLCSLANYRNDSTVATADTQNAKQRVSLMAWAGFQVLSNRCVAWELEDGGVLDDLEHSGLACQVSTLLTNHLARATECSGNEAAGNEALQEVLSLLNELSKSKMGRAILSQPGCVSKLMSLLLDQRPSPKLVLVILQLCRVALPLMSSDDCEHIELPAWGAHMQQCLGGDLREQDGKPLMIASLLLAKLGDFLVPGEQSTVASRRPSHDAAMPCSSSGSSTGTAAERDKSEDKDVQDGRLTVYIHKRDDQSFHEVVQPLLSAENRPFRLSGGAGNMEKILRMDRDMTRSGRAEVTCEEAVSALRKAAKWAQMGLVVSTGPPVDATQADAGRSDKKKTNADVICKEKNIELARTDPVRPFISGHVANSMASEVIALLHGLLTAPETLAAQTWNHAVEKVLAHALSCLPLLLNSVDELGSPRCNKEQLMVMAKQVSAALAALGGFEELVKPGCTVQITGEGVEDCAAQVVSVSEQSGLATVRLLPATSAQHAPTRYSDTVQVPLARLTAQRSQSALSLYELSMTESIVSAIQGLLLPQGGSYSQLAEPLPVHGADALALSNQICRVVAEIRSRACQVLALNLKELAFTSAFIQHSSASIDILKQLAKDCSAGERLESVAELCHRMRMFYRDCAKPPPPPTKLPSRTLKEVVWDTRRAYPPVRACLFSHGMTGITFLADPGAGSGLPRGTIVYASQPVPSQAPSFYWELEVSSLGDSQEESGPFISCGFMPAAERKDSGWTQPVGSCLFHNNGRAVHYNGASLLQWRSVRLDIALSAGDVIGIGWERVGESPSIPGQSVKGRVYFTHNGRRQAPTMEEVSGAMWPVVHLQKKNTRVRANFGSRSFLYAEGREHRNAADECHDTLQEMRDGFGALPFNVASDSDSDAASLHSATSEIGGRDVHTPPGPPCRTPAIPKSLKEYQSEASVYYKLLPCYETFTHTGPDTRTQAANQEAESDISDGEEEEPQEDHYALLVKAWEQKVFPVIRRRFRNEAERKDGLEQIKGALQLGMVDIARQTVEFLYEENGGMPRDLHLPTIDDIREELAKFTIERVRKGTTVVIRSAQTSATPTGTTLLPKYAVRSMVKTFGLTGIVLDIDQGNELVQVETYLRSEGVLVRFWYPLEMLERPPHGYRKSSLVGQQCLDTANIHIHRELLRHESTLAKMYCRAALLELIAQCNSPAMELTSCATGLGTAMAASAALLQELDVENLQLLSNELLAAPQPHGGVMATNLTTAPSPWRCLAPHMCSPSQIFYNNSRQLREELKVAIARAANQGEDYVIELSNQICMCLQTAPEMFPCEEFPINENKICTDVHFPEAAFLVISCKTDPKAVKKETSLYKSPWARIYTYRGQRIKKSGQSSKQEVVCYPRDVTSCSNQNDQYAPVIIPGDLIHIRVGVSPPPGVILTVHALPTQYSLALTYIETLVSGGPNFEYRRYEAAEGKATEVPGCTSSSRGVSPSGVKDSALTSPWRTFDSIVVTPSVLMYVCDLMCGYLWRTDAAALTKEHVFHLLAQALRMLRASEAGMGDITPTLTPHYSPTMALLKQLQCELKTLYEEEVKGFPSGRTVSGPGLGLGVGDQGRFSTYFQSLLEVCLAVAEVTPLHPTPGIDLSAVESKPTESSPSLTLTLPSSPVAVGKRKKLKAKRERASSGGLTRRSGSPRRPSESESPLSSSPVDAESSGASASSSVSKGDIQDSKPEEMLWYHRAITMSQILRYVSDGDSQGHVVTNDAVADVYNSTSVSTAHARLLVITGIPPVCDADLVTRAVSKAAKAAGGLFKEEIYLPTVAHLETEREQTGKKSPRGGAAAPAGKITLSTTSQGNSANSQGSPNVNIASEKEGGKAAENVVKLTQPRIKGCAVIEVRAKCNLESVRKALTKNKTFLEGLSLSPDQVVELADEMLSISTVNQNLFAELQGASNDTVDDYLLQKLTCEQQLQDGALAALTDIFHSCFISEQRLWAAPEPRGHESGGFICLGRDQIVSTGAGNLMHVFFNACRSGKKPTADCVRDVLRRYGVPKVTDKDDSDKKSKQSKKPTRPVPREKPSKEKLALGVAAPKPLPKEKKVRGKETKESLNAKASNAAAQPPTTSKESREDDKLLTLDGFLQYVLDKSRHDVKLVWRALLACGYDLHFERFKCNDVATAQQMSESWSVEMDAALVHHVNVTCQRLAVAPARLHPHELYLTEEEMTSDVYAPLHGVAIENVRLRFALLQFLNNTLETFFLPLIDMRTTMGGAYTRSTGALLARARACVFYDTKMVLLNRVINATVKRKPDQAAPEVTLDPLENIAGMKKAPADTNLCQALRQLSSVPSRQLCVQLAAGGDPTYSFNVRLTGEEVHGTSGSFRHFLWQVARELEGSVLDLFMLCPSAAGQKNKGKYILRPGPMSFAEEKLLIFLGQLFAVTIRADIPFGIDLLAVFWKNLVGLDLDPVTDLQDADIITYNYIKKFEMLESEEELRSLYAEQVPRFVFTNLNGEEVELIPNGSNLCVNCENKQLYADTIRHLRMEELRCRERVRALQSGVSSVVPLQLFSLMTAADAQIRTCGTPCVDLNVLKTHTMYQVGLMESDAHIQYFWAVLESFTADELSKFVKFACNQERIPSTCPCRDGGADTAHVPPYPMKIAPPDGPGAPDARHIRVETCMFMVKLPQYSSQQLMRKRLLYAIHCREDPLSG